jgi:DNA-binding transcriptional MerR regulator
LSRNTITAWERRYNLIEPGRDDSGYRTYSEGDVALLRAIKHKLDEGYAIREAINIARGAPESVPVEVGSTSELLDALLQCLLDLDRGCAEEIHARLLALPYRTRVDDVYLPLLRRVGDLWAQGGANVAQEHFTSAFCRDHLVGMLQNVGHGPEDGPLAVCAGYPGEPHELGLLAVAVKLALRGFRVMWLGADLPAADLIAACQGLAPVLVCQSVIQPLPSAQILAPRGTSCARASSARRCSCSAARRSRGSSRTTPTCCSARRSTTCSTGGTSCGPARCGSPRPRDGR